MPNAQSLLAAAFAEDFGPKGYPAGDLTTQLLIPEATQARLALTARTPLTVAGTAYAQAAFHHLDPSLQIEIHLPEGARAAPGQALLTASGPARPLLSAERVALNLLQRACGIATLTRAYVDAVAGTEAKILDTRKTMPGLRALDKHAVTCGGGLNHRFGLYDAVLIKDNHIALARQRGESLPALIARAREGAGGAPVIVECDTLAQVEQALSAAPDRLLLDNMSLPQLREAVALGAGRLPLEASGGITLATARPIAETGVNYLSIGALTHSAPAADIGADITFS